MTWYVDPLLRNCRHIVIKDIHRDIFIGAYEHETHTKQPVLINIDVNLNTDDDEDRVDNAYNYDEVFHADDLGSNRSHICLQETLIDAIASNLFNNPLVQAVLVKSEKTQAYSDVKSAGVEIFRTRHD